MSNENTNVTATASTEWEVSAEISGDNLIVTMPRSIPLPFILERKVADIIDFDFAAVKADALNAVVKYLIDYGLKQTCNDGGAVGKQESPEKAAEMKRAGFDKRINTLRNGTMRLRGAAEVEPTDPVEVEWLAMGKAAIAALLAEARIVTRGKNATIDKDGIAALVTEWQESAEGVAARAVAAETVARRAALSANVSTGLAAKIAAMKAGK